MGTGRSIAGWMPATAEEQSARVQTLCCDGCREENQDQEECHREQARGAKQREEDRDLTLVHAPETAKCPDMLRRVRCFSSNGGGS